MDALRDLGCDSRLSPLSRRLKPRSCCSSPLGGDPLKLVDGNQFAAPRHLDRLDVGEKPAESRKADPQSLRGLGAGVSESFDIARLADDHPRVRGLRPPLNGTPQLVVVRSEVAASLVGAPLLAASGHGVRAYMNDGTILHLGASASRLLFVYGADAAGWSELDAAAQAVL